MLPRYIAKGDISRLNVYIAKGDISRLIFNREINVHGRKQRYTEIKFRNEQKISIHLGISTVTVKPVQVEFCLRNIQLPMQPFMQDTTPPRAQPFVLKENT